VAAKDEQKETTEKGSGGSKKKWIFIIGGIVILAIVAGVLVFFLMRGDGEDEEGSEEGENTHESSKENNSHAKAVYPLEALIVNIHDGPELRYLKIKLEFEIKDAETKGEIDPFMAPMQDAILMLLSGKQMGDITTTEGKNKLKEEIMASVGKIVPPGKITRVYITDFVVQ
jgi:flagellar FliL protein